MDLTLSLPSSISRPQDRYRTPGYRLLITKLIRFESPHRPLAGRTTMSALRSLNVMFYLGLDLPRHTRALALSKTSIINTRDTNLLLTLLTANTITNLTI